MLDGLAISSFQVLLKVGTYQLLPAALWMILLSPVSCAAISDGCLQGSNDANWVLYCTNIVLCVVPASSSRCKATNTSAEQQAMESIEFSRFYFYSVLSWAAKRMPKSSCFHAFSTERISPAVGPVNFCIVHRLLICNVVLQTTWLDQRQSIVCVWSIVLGQERKRLSACLLQPSFPVLFVDGYILSSHYELPVGTQTCAISWNSPKTILLIWYDMIWYDMIDMILRVY